MEDHVREILKHLGEDPNRSGLERTPERVRESLEFLTSGYREDVEALLKGAVFEEEHDEMIIVKDISMYSLCEHHMLPFFGKCHVAYIPKGRIIGISKIPRVVEVFSRRLQIQERLTNQIAKTLMEHLEPRGVAVTIEAIHLCMEMRGVMKRDSMIVTSSMLGAFRSDSKTRMEFLNLIGSGGRHKG
ncbi:MAG: GTP cyclohydrolase I FolE [Candidatus Krumholzibacteria bacterium]|jgi:GTP cyclohydrolase I|nr:GTP cyclohydrolase I FolE [Candidatus Krumholzibacteria bacterium]